VREPTDTDLKSPHGARYKFHFESPCLDLIELVRVVHDLPNSSEFMFGEHSRLQNHTSRFRRIQIHQTQADALGCQPFDQCRDIGWQSGTPSIWVEVTHARVK
jgi:hypothetical protein